MPRNISIGTTEHIIAVLQRILFNVTPLAWYYCGRRKWDWRSFTPTTKPTCLFSCFITLRSTAYIASDLRDTAVQMWVRSPTTFVSCIARVITVSFGCASCFPTRLVFSQHPACLDEAILHGNTFNITKVWITWLFIAYSDGRWLYYQFSLHHFIHFSFKGWENVVVELGGENG